MNPKVSLFPTLRLLLLNHVRLMLVVDEVDNRCPRVTVVDVVAEARGVNDGQGNADTILLKLCMRYTSRRCVGDSGGRPRTDVDRLDPDTLLNVRSLRAIADLMLQNLRLA